MTQTYTAHCWTGQAYASDLSVGCGHKHKTPEAAIKCALEHQRNAEAAWYAGYVIIDNSTDDQLDRVLVERMADKVAYDMEH